MPPAPERDLIGRFAQHPVAANPLTAMILLVGAPDPRDLRPLVENFAAAREPAPPATPTDVRT